MEVIFLAMSIVFWGFVLLVVSKFGILPSLSESYYNLSENKRNIIFTSVFLWTGMLAAIIVDSYLMKIAGVGICLVGVAPQFKDNMVKPAHFLGAFVAAIFSQIYIATNTPYWWITIIFLIACLITILVCKLVKSENLTWWLEMWCFLTTFLAIGLIVY